MAFWNWSRIAANNATATGGTWAEGMAPSSVNDTARINASELACYRDDIAGAIVTGGSSTAYTVGSYQVFDSLAHLANQMVAFTPHTTNGATVTLNVDSLGAKPLRTSPGIELLAGTIIQGTPYVATYNNSDGAFYLQGFFGNPFNMPLAGGMDYWGTTVPNSSFAFPIGQAISRTTYSALFAIMATTYGVGDGSTTFNLPDKTGRVSAMKEASGTRLTSTYFGGNSANLGAVGGAEKETLLTANLPPYTPAGSVAVTSTPTNVVSGTLLNVALGGGAVTFTIAANGAISAGQIASTGTLTGTAQGGTSTPVATVPPLIICNYILRII